MTQKTSQPTIRPPVIAVLGHVDHGKSSLLDFIRKTNVVAGEAGGITQGTAAYEVVHAGKDGREMRMTFIDTPGHEAFAAQRSRGAAIADIAVLVVSAEDGPKPQTLEAYAAIQSAQIPCIVAINKIDLPAANIDAAIAKLTESGIYLEGRGGSLPFVAVSAKTGEGILELLDMILLVAEVENLTADEGARAEGFVIEAHRDPKKGLSATFIIKNGMLKKGMFVAASGTLAPVRTIFLFDGKQADSAGPSSPVSIVGWDALPDVGAEVRSFENKKQAEQWAAAQKNKSPARQNQLETPEETEIATIPLILKADVSGSLDALRHEVAKIQSERVRFKILHADAGAVGENDVKRAGGDPRTVILGFNTTLDPGVAEAAERLGIVVKTETIIYKLAEFLAELAKERQPKVKTQEVHGRAKILKLFSSVKTKQIIGARVEEGAISHGDAVSVLRRTEDIGSGKIIELQVNRQKISEVLEGAEFGAKVDCAIALAAGDIFVSYRIVEK